VKGDEGKAPITPTLDAVKIFSGETEILNGTRVLAGAGLERVEKYVDKLSYYLVAR
jgi:hypothetical protein